MKRLLLFLVLLTFIGVPQVSLAQTDDTCSPEAVQIRVNLAITQYQATSPSDASSADALATLNNLQSTLDTLEAECQNAIEAEQRAELTSIYNDLQEGGYIIYVRHTHTDRSNGDSDLSQCETNATYPI